MTTRPSQTAMLVQKWQWRTDAKGQIVSISPSFEDATGIDPTIIIGKTFEEISSPVYDLTGESDKQLKRYLTKCKSKQGFRTINLPINSPENGFRLIQISGTPEFGKHKKFLGYSGTGIDTSYKTETDAKLAAAYIPYADVLEGLGDGFAIWDRKGHLLLFNNRFKSFFGDNKKNVKQGARLSALSHLLKSRALTIEPDTAGSLLDVDPRKNSRNALERQVQFIDGNWVIISARKIENDVIATTLTDITKIKNREVEATRDAQRNAQMAVAIAAMDSGVIITNPNMPDNPIIFINPSFVSPMGGDTSKVLGTPFKSLFSTPENEQSFGLLKRAMSIRETCSVNIHHKDETGNDRWFELHLSPILTEANRTSYFLGIQNDITVQKNAEIELGNRMLQQSAVAELGGKALAETDLYELFDEAVKSIVDILDVNLISIREHIPETDEMIVRAAYGWKKNVIGLTSSGVIPGSFIDRIFSSGETETYSWTKEERKREGPVMGEKGIHTSVGIRIAGRRHPFGTLTVHCKKSKIFTSDEINFLETIAYILGVAVERSQADDALKESEYRFELAVKGSNDGIWDCDLTTNKMYYSERWKAMLGLSDEIVAETRETWVEHTHAEDRQQVEAALKAHLRNETPDFSCEHRMLHQDGSYRWMLVRGLAIRDEAGRATRIAGSLSDITDAKRAEHQLVKDALHDALTNLPNRALFTDRLVQSLTRSSRQPDHLFAVMFLDFDRFKLINDSLGHSFGDHLLIEIGHRLKECIREVDTVARLGGDEFAILLNDLETEKTAEEVANRINHSLGQAFNLSGREIVSNASIGIAFSSLGYSHPEEMIRDADIAMYQAKSEGRARHIIFEPGMHVKAVSLLEMETNLRQAIEKKQFTLAYQPVVDINTEELIGFEALIRWAHPKRGNISPGEFIPIAEETKLIIPIGRWVIEEACHQLKEWQNKFPNLAITVSVNISPEQFKDSNLIEDVRDILTEKKIDGKFLKVEITESAIMENPREVTKRLEQLRKMGIQLHVDDFGTGYSSLSHLHSFPIDALKIDRSFVISMGDSQENTEIVRTIIALAHNLGLTTVAEGVESKEDQMQLKKLDCDLAQGYYFSKPLSVKDATKYITKKNKAAKKRQKK